MLKKYTTLAATASLLLAESQAAFPEPYKVVWEKPAESEVRWQFWNGKAWTGTTAARTEHLVTMRLEGEVDADPRKWPAEAMCL